MGFKENFLGKLEKLREENPRGWQSALAAKAGLRQNSISRILSSDPAKRQTPGLDTVAAIIDAMGPGFFADDETIALSDYAMIPKVSARAGAGSSLITDEHVEGLYAFRIPFLTRLGIHEKSSVLMMVMGQSMEPVLCDGDTVLVDQSDTEPQDGRIFVIGLEEELLVKRLQKIPGGWSIVSANPSYAPISVTGSYVELLRIYGRVRWVGREM